MKRVDSLSARDQSRSPRRLAYSRNGTEITRILNPRNDQDQLADEIVQRSKRASANEQCAFRRVQATATPKNPLVDYCAGNARRREPLQQCSSGRTTRQVHRDKALAYLDAGRQGLVCQLQPFEDHAAARSEGGFLLQTPDALNERVVQAG